MGFVMIASILVLPFAALAMQGASDTTRTAREAYTGCLRGFVERSLESRMTAEAFNTAYPQQCTAQEAAYRAAVIQRETATRATRATAEQSAIDAIDEAKLNFRERFEMELPAPAATTPAPATTTPPATTPPTQPPAPTTPQ